MKSKVLTSFCVMAISAMSFTVFADDPTKPSAPSTPEVKICKWEIDSCGLFKGDREICVETGDGNECGCGSVTRKC